MILVVAVMSIWLTSPIIKKHHSKLFRSLSGRCGIPFGLLLVSSTDDFQLGRTRALTRWVHHVLSLFISTFTTFSPFFLLLKSFEMQNKSADRFPFSIFAFAFLFGPRHSLSLTEPVNAEQKREYFHFSLSLSLSIFKFAFLRVPPHRARERRTEARVQPTWSRTLSQMLKEERWPCLLLIFSHIYTFLNSYEKCSE